MDHFSQLIIGLKQKVKDGVEERVDLLMDNYNNYDKLYMLRPSEQTLYFDKRLRNIEKLLALMLQEDIKRCQGFLTEDEIQAYVEKLDNIKQKE